MCPLPWRNSPPPGEEKCTNANNNTVQMGAALTPGCGASILDWSVC